MHRLLLICVAVMTAATAHAAPPNIIVLITDDQGYGELSCHGNPVVRTPNLDRLHSQSVRFTDFHVAPMCTPTRGQLLTGVDALRNGAMNVSSGRTLLRREFPTLPEMLRPAGYTSGIFGKWHLGDNYPFRAQDRGFNAAITFPSSHIGSVPDRWMNDYFDDTYSDLGTPRKFEGYTTEVFFREAMAWMAKQQSAGKPFFVYLPTAAPHGPLYVPQAYRQRVRQRLDAAREKLPPMEEPALRSLASYLGMIEHIDDQVGLLEAFLEKQKLRQNTILVYLTDNGSTFGPRYFNAGMKGSKTTLWEGGHRVPLFVRWPAGKLGESRDVPTLAQVQDVTPTLLELADVATPATAKFDGRSLVPLLRGSAAEWPDRTLFINFSRMPLAATAGPGKPNPANPTREGTAVLRGRWRFLEDKALYDLSTDPMQEHDVAADHPDVVASMRASLNQWWDGVKDRVNEPSRIVIGSDAENPSMLTACEWWNVFVDQQAQVRRGERKNGIWHLQVEKPGEYEFELRRWPREAALALTAAAPAAKLTDGNLPAGEALPIAGASISIDGQAAQADVAADAEHATFKMKLEAGPVEMQATFVGKDGKPIAGAYYVYVRRM